MPRILVTDDTAADRTLLASLLQPYGHQVIEAHDGEQALSLLQKESVDLVVTDILMPTMDGYEFVHRLRAMPKHQDVPVLFWSAVYREREARKLAEACGVSALVTKPVEPEKLLEVVNSILEQGVAPSSPVDDFETGHVQTLNQKLFDSVAELESTNRRLQRIFELNVEFASETAPERFLSEFCHAVRDIVAASSAVLGILDKAGDKLHYFYTSGVDPQKEETLRPTNLRAGILERVLKSRQSLRIRDPAAALAEIGIDVPISPLNSILCVPIMSLTTEYGWLLLMNKVGENEFSENDQELAHTFASQVGRIYENSSLYADSLAHADKLEREIAERRRAERDRDRVVRDLRERVKELTLLHEAARFLSKDDTPQSVLTNIVRLIPPAWQYSEITEARITWDGIECQTDGFTQTPWMQRAEIATETGHHGSVEVCYKEEKPDAFEGPFLRDERRLIDSLAEMLFAHLARRAAVEAMERSERYLRTVIDTSPECIKVVDRDGAIRQMNPAGLRMLEADRDDQVIGRKVAEFVAPEDWENVRAFHKAICRGETRGLEFCLIGLKGTRRNVESFATRLYDPRDPDLVHLALTRDITQRKEAERELRRSELRYRSLAESTSNFIWKANAAGEVVDPIPVWQEFTGTSLDDAHGWGWVDAVHPDDREFMTQQWEKSLEDQSSFEVEHRLRRYDGIYRWFVTRAVPIHDENNEVYEWIGVSADISERKESELKIRELAMIVESTADGVIGVNLDGLIKSWNPGATRIFGYEPEEILGHSITMLAVADRVDEQLGFLNRLTQAKRIDQFETLWLSRDSQLIHVSLTVSPVHNEKGIISGGSFIVRDISERKALEAQLRQAVKMEAVGRLAGGVAHDFNNMLTIINGYSEIILMQLKADNPMREMIQQIHSAGERSARLTTQLLAFGRKQILEPVDLNLNDVIRELEKMLRRLIGEDIDLVSILDPDIDLVRADPTQMENVIVNLAINARDAMPTGGSLTLETRNQKLDEAYAEQRFEVTPGHYVMLAVSDNGCGMNEDTKKHIFEPFFTTKEVGKGTGLGLASVFGVVKQSGGHIEVYSEQGQGTTFKIYLPRVDTGAQARGKSVELAMPTGTETILLAEDEEGVRSLAQSALEAAGYTLLLAKNGEQALAVFEQHQGQVHLLLTDVVMPKMSGADLHRRLSESHPKLKVLFMSGYTDEAIIRHGVLQSGQAFIHKPFSPMILARKVREVLDDAGESK